MREAQKVEIVGAGPAGLSAALAARAGGAEVIVYEKRSDVGARFHGDFQGLENWTSETDVLTELRNLGIEPTFDYTPVREFICFDPGGKVHELRAAQPIFYLIRRGNESGMLDRALKKQALDAGITIKFGSRHRQLPFGGIVAEGPRRANVIAAGYVFETDMANGCYAAVSDRLAPAGYSYLLINQGRGTVATCMFERFHDERHFVEETVSFFQREVGLKWHQATRFGGSGNFNSVTDTISGDRLYAGESAGFQDALFGFGLRYALISGHLAGRADGSGSAYQQASLQRLSGLNTASIFNRWLYARLGDRGRRIVLRRVAHGRDPRSLLRRVYAPTWWKASAARWLPDKLLLRNEHLKSDCDCTWCRCRSGKNSDAVAAR